MNFVNGDFRFKGMKKASEFTMYPCRPGQTEIFLQSDTRMVKVDLTTGLALVSKRCPNGAGFLHASLAMGAEAVTLPETDLEHVRAMRDRMAGLTNRDGSLTLVGAKRAEVREIVVEVSPADIFVKEDALKE